MAELGSMLIELAAEARRELVMCAPFAKQTVVDRVLQALPGDVGITLFTRWRPEEVASGVSDTEVLCSVRSRGGVVFLHDRLHAKFYRNENRTLIGSANLTATALGWSTAPNLELLVESSDSDAHRLEELLRTQGVEATDAMAQQVEEVAELLPKNAAALDNEPLICSVEEDLWIPKLRIPSDLYLAYSRGVGYLTGRSADAAARDLAVLEVPPGLDRRQFGQIVGLRLYSHPAFITIDEFLTTPRRFGEVSRLLGELIGLNRGDADEAWQTMMRWLLEFRPQSYTRTVARHTEVMTRLTHEMEP